MNDQRTQNNADEGRSELSGIVSCAELREVCELTVKLTEQRQNECKHLCIENFAPDLFARLLYELSVHKKGMIRSEFRAEWVNLKDS